MPMSPEAPDPGRSAADSFRRLFEAHYDDVVRFVSRRAAQDAVDDVVAEVFVTAWRRFDELPTGPGSVRPWLFATAHRTLANTRRGRRRRRALAVRIASQPSADADDPCGVIHRVDLTRAFGRLRARDREALALVAWDGLSPAEAARVLEISDKAFSVRLSRARTRLRTLLEPPPGDPS